MRTLPPSILLLILAGPALACDRAVPVLPSEATATVPAVDPGPRPPRQRCISAADLDAIRARYAERPVPLPPRRAEGL